MDESEVDRKSVRDITSDDNNLLKEYGDIHIKIAQMCVGSKGLHRSQSIAFFNDSYRMGKDIRDSRSIFTYPVSVEEQNNHPEMLYLSRVLKLCASSDICNKLGLSIKDFMEMDLNTFSYIEDYWDKLTKKESKETKNILADHGINIDKL